MDFKISSKINNKIESDLLSIGYYNLSGNTTKSNEIIIGSNNNILINDAKKLLIDRINNLSKYDNNFLLYKNTINDYDSNKIYEKIFIKLSNTNSNKYLLLDLIYDHNKLIQIDTKEYDSYNFDDLKSNNIYIPINIEKLV